FPCDSAVHPLNQIGVSRFIQKNPSTIIFRVTKDHKSPTGILEDFRVAEIFTSAIWSTRNNRVASAFREYNSILTKSQILRLHGTVHIDMARVKQGEPSFRERP